jgi:hypothetical protein
MQIKNVIRLRRIYLIFLILFFIVSPVFASDINCSCNDSSKCYSDGCSRKPKTAQNTFDEGRYDSVCAGNPPFTFPGGVSDKYFCSEHQPDCCFDLKKYHDNRLCCWQERFYCHPSLCNGTSNQCGWYWDWHSQYAGYQYACVMENSPTDLPPAWPLPPNLGGVTQPSPTKAPTAVPTQRPQPTTILQQPTTYHSPTPAPTTVVGTTNPQATHTPIPTSPPANTTPMTINGNNPYQINSPTSYQISNPFSFHLPTLPTIDTTPLKNSVKIGVIRSARFLDLFSFAFNQITSLDKKLENSINHILPLSLQI